jgi:hypothetical protein
MSGTRRRKARTYWDEVTLAMPYTFTRAVVDVAHKYRMPPLEYIRRALMLRLEADGVRIEDYDEAA